MRKNRTICRRGLALLLSLVLCLGMIPGTAWAADTKDVWDGTVATGFAGGTGTETDPYQIANGEQLAYLAEEIWKYADSYGNDKYKNSYFELTADIDLSGCEWKPIGGTKGTTFYPFRGHFIGRGHTISGLKITASTDYTQSAGLFGCIVAAEICDLRLTNATVSLTGTSNASTGGAGALVGYSSYGTYSLICNVTVSGSKISWHQYVGGIVGNDTSYTQIKKCTVENSNITANHWGAGGIIGGASMGRNDGETFIIGCASENNTISSKFGAVGGIMGFSGKTPGGASTSGKVTIRNCYNTSSVSYQTVQMPSTSSVAQYPVGAGGILGYSWKAVSGKISGNTIQDSSNFGTITTPVGSASTGKGYAGGIVGYAMGFGISFQGNQTTPLAEVSMKNCYNGGTIETTNTSSTNKSYVELANLLGYHSVSTAHTANQKKVYLQQGNTYLENCLQGTATLRTNDDYASKVSTAQSVPSIEPCGGPANGCTCGCHCSLHSEAPKPTLTDIQKAQIDSIPSEVENAATDLNLSEKKDGKYIITDGKVTLLYQITITGDEGAKYIVTDEGAAWVGGDGEPQADGTITGEIAEGKDAAVIYVTKEFTVANDATAVTNQAFLEAGDDTELNPAEDRKPDIKDDKLPSNETSTDVTGDSEEEALKLTDFSKVRVTNESSVPAGINTDGVNFDEQVVATAGGSVTLLYKITVTGEEGAKYDVSDEDADRVGGAELTGTLGESESAVIYVTKTFDNVTAATELTNTAVLRPGEGTELEPADEADKDKPTPDPDDPEKKVWEESSDPASPAVLGIIKSVDKLTAEVGDELTYTITVTNSGSEAVTGVTVTDTLPDGVDFVRAGQRGSYVFDDRTVTWSNRTIPAKSGEENGKLELTLTVRAKAEGAIANTARLTAPVTKDSNEVTTNVGPKSNPHISVTKEMGDAVVDADAGTATVEYTVTVKNDGNVDLYGLRVDDTLTTKVKTSEAKMTIKPVSGYVGEETDSNVTVNGNTERSWTLVNRNDTFAIGATKVLKYQLVLENTGDDNLSVDLENTAVGGAWSKQATAASGDPSQMPGRRAVRLSNDDPDITDEGSASGSNIGSSSGNVVIPAKCKHLHDEDGYCTEPGCKHIEEGKTCCEKRPDAPVDYELTYSSNGGVGTMVAQTASSTDSSHTFIVLANGFTREGWHFTGWNTEADGSGDAYGAGGEMTLQASAPTATLYAQWAENITPPVEYTYKLTCYDGTGKTDVQTVTTTAEKHTFVIPTVSRPGYELLGWSETEGGCVDYTAGERITLTSDDPEADLYAVWKELETDPEISDEEILALGIKVRVVCSANETHDETIRAEYALQEGTFEPLMSHDGKSCTLRIIPDAYIERFNNEYGTHSYDETNVQGFVELVYVEPELDIDVQFDEQDPAPVPDGEEMLPVQEPVEPNDELNDDLSGTPDSDVAGDTQITDDTDGSTEPLANEGEDAENGKSSDPVEFFPMALEGEEETAGWQLADGERGIVTFSVYCEKQEPDEPETEEVTVTWLSGYGANAAIKTEVIVKGSDYSGLYPGAPTHDGYRFTGWSAPVTDPAAGNITITAQWEALPDESRTVTVTWQNWNGDLLARENWDQDDPEPSYPGRRPTRPDSSRYTYTFDGWDREVDDDGNVTYTARFDRERIDDDDIGGGGGGTGGGTTTTPPATNIPDVDVPQGDTTTIADDQTPLAGAIGLNNTEHFAYMIGYDDGTVGPMNQITRAEVATIFFRLMDDSFRSQYWSTVSGFSDVTAGKWFNNAVSTATNAGKLTGYPDGTFRPNQSITRAEFAAIAVRFLSDEVQGVSGGNFSDTEGHWAADAIGRAAAAGWIAGYPDGTFRPNAPITRAEAATIINNMLGRAPDKGHLLDDMIVWPDNPETAWYYEAIQEATNSHDYERDELGITEIWSAIQTVRDWKALEEQWAA